jgi:hypothetical protein
VHAIPADGTGVEVGADEIGVKDGKDEIGAKDGAEVGRAIGVPLGEADG